MSALHAMGAAGAMRATDTVAAAWQARLDLQFAARGARTVLARRKHCGPLIVQRPFYPEGGICHVYLVHPPGGIVGGDQLTLNVEAQPGSHTLITTPAATKFYRAGPHPAARMQQHLQVRDSALEWLPQETILFDGARAITRTVVQMHGPLARFLGWEITCIGRPASGETFRVGTLAQDLLLYHDDQPLLLDRLRLQGGCPALTSAWGLGGMQALGTLLMYPAQHADVAALRSLQAPGVRFALTRVQGVLLCRALAMQAEPIRALFSAMWSQLRPGLLGCGAMPPRIWAT